MIDDPVIVRALALWLPILGLGIWILAFGLARADRLVLLFAGAWQLPLLWLLNEAAHHFGWWQFHCEGGLLFHVPVDLILGWAILWAIPALWRRLSILFAVLLCLGFDLLVMPQLGAVLVLGDHWLVGEGLALGLILVPYLLYSRIGMAAHWLRWRILFYALSYGGLFFILLPSIVLHLRGDNWAGLIAGDFFASLWRSFLVLSLLPGISAALEFAKRGQGSPLPFDPPKRLVQSGLYAYVANPMQMSCFLAYIFLGLLLHNYWICLGALAGWFWSIGLAANEEKLSLKERFPGAWEDYRASVRLWLPRARPFVPTAAPRPILYVAGNCKKCQAVRNFLEARAPLGLVIEAAEQHPTRDLLRLTYDPGDGSGDEEGVAAFMRALDHLSLPYALFSALARTPGLIQLLQWLADAVGAGPMLVRRETGGGKSS